MMSRLLGFLRPPPQEHAELGPLQYASGRWRGTVALENGARIPLFIPGSRSGPDPEGLKVAELASAWWTEARPDVERELYDHYSAGRDDPTDGTLELRDSGEVWAHAVPTSVAIKPFRLLDEIQVAIRVAWDEEHTLGAMIRDGRLVGLNGSILEPR
jgi:hypothetical protein